MFYFCLFFLGGGGGSLQVVMSKAPRRLGGGVVSSRPEGCKINDFIHPSQSLFFSVSPMLLYLGPQLRALLSLSMDCTGATLYY